MNPWAVLGIALVGLAALVARWIEAGQAQATGRKLQSGADAAVAARAEAAMAEAEAQAPTTQASVFDRLNQGTF